MNSSVVRSLKALGVQAARPAAQTLADYLAAKDAAA
jgi:hypothetical protein